MGVTTQSWKQEDRLDTVVLFLGELSRASFKPLQHPESSSLPHGWDTQAECKRLADELPVITWMEDFSCAPLSIDRGLVLSATHHMFLRNLRLLKPLSITFTSLACVTSLPKQGH